MLSRTLLVVALMLVPSSASAQSLAACVKAAEAQFKACVTQHTCAASFQLAIDRCKDAENARLAAAAAAAPEAWEEDRADEWLEGDWEEEGGEGGWEEE